MSLTTPYAESYLTANGVDITFGFSFDAISENYVRCLVYMPDETVITPTFTVDIAAGEVSIVSMTTPDGELLQVPPAGATVRIFREVPEAQDATASTLQAFTSKQLEKALDKVVATVQQVDYKTTHKTVRTTETERDVWLDKLTADNDDELLKWDEDGHQITTSGLTEQGIRNETAQAIATANEAKSIATEARTTANDAKTTADEAKAIAQNAATDAETAVQKSTEATNIANEANTTADSAKTTATNADAKSDTAVSTANSASQKATTALTQSSEAMADAKDSLTKSEQAVATANDAKTTADGIDGKATTALTKSEQAVATANDAKTTADGKVSKSGDTMLGDLILGQGSSIYLSDVGSSALTSTSRIYIGTPEKKYACLAGNRGGVFGIYNADMTGGISCYPGTNFFPSNQTKQVDLGRAQNYWKTLYAVNVTDGTTTMTFTDIISGAKGGATAVQPNANVSVLKNDAGYLTQHQSLTDLGITASATELNYTDGVTSNIQTQLNSKQSTISDLATIRSNAQSGKTASNTIATYGNIVTHNTSEFATSAQGAKADTAVQPADLATVATSGSYNDLSNKPTIPSTLAGLTGDVSISSPAQGQHLVYDGSKWKNSTSSASISWGGITGTLSNQSDLQTALNAKQAKGNYVTTDTAQTVTGVKTFQQGSDTALVKVQNSTTALGTTPTAEKTTQVRFDDKNGDWIGLVSSKVETDGSTSVELCVRKPDKSGSGFISVDSDASGNISFNASDGVKDTIKSWIPSASVDNKSITKNASDEIQAVGVIDANTASVVKTWTGTLAEYTALATKSDDTQYIITDDDSAGTNVYTKAEVDSLVTSAVAEANAHRVIAFQAPTADNNYTWYRLYSDGWVEQGGIYTISSAVFANFNLVVQMANNNYTIVGNCLGTTTSTYSLVFSQTDNTTTTFSAKTGQANTGNFSWQVSGMAA